METSGKYTVSYTPSNDPHEYLQVAVEMSISSEATLSDMAAFFTDFLRASGYVFDGELSIKSDKTETTNTPDQDFWFNDGFSFVGSGMLGGASADTISFGAAQPVEFNSYYGRDIVSF